MILDFCYLEGWLDGWLDGMLDGCVDGKLDGCEEGWLDGREEGAEVGIGVGGFKASASQIVTATPKSRRSPLAAPYKSSKPTKKRMQSSLSSSSSDYDDSDTIPGKRGRRTTEA